MHSSINNDQEEIDFLNYYLNETLQKPTTIDEFPFEEKIKIDYLSEASQPIEKDILETISLNKDTETDIIVPKEKAELINQLFKNITTDIKTIKNLIKIDENKPDNKQAELSKTFTNQLSTILKTKNNTEDQIIEGVFDGENMIGDNGKQYSVAANYISKSKLVQGDKLKLTIKLDGTFIYKQTEQVERTSVIYPLEITPEGKYFIASQSQKWQILKASVTYYKGEKGDQVIALIPKNEISTWAAVEHITRNI